MKNTSAELDAYIAEAPEYSRPILRKLRSLFHKACPQIEETMKWSFPHFEYKGIVGSMAAFKNYVSFGFWKGTLMSDRHQLFKTVGDTGMNACKVAAVSELPSDKILLEHIREAVELNKKGVKLPKPKRSPIKKVGLPDYFMEALAKNKKALVQFDAFNNSQKKEYVEWITGAKQEATRAERLATAIAWIAEGKTRHWKYQKR